MSGELKWNLGLTEQPENAFSYLRNTGETRNYFLGQTRDKDCGLCWGGRIWGQEQWLESKDKKVRVKQKGDLLGDKDGRTHIMWSDWSTVDRYCLKRLRTQWGLLACAKHHLTRTCLGLTGQTLHCPVNLCFHLSPPPAFEFLKGRHCYIQFSVPSTLPTRQSSNKRLSSVVGNAQKTWALFLALP